ncbi:hypothetical protein PS858_03726 [Pseudomonas fluorescens]|uniref:SGNH/GDSL hydrolase family protein n=1 Tax=Pseudomonas fluorescens TaxID=294 RepID=UPI00123F213A|nr:GDSL-type esterase/lipase family protein [Pseudomonas fluorescens]VVP19382.1 hypothetical protein PS858_03726 [Pseudomonas fluorescens]
MIKRLWMKIALFFSAMFSFHAMAANVLIVGDSISMGYTPFVQQIMGDKANVSHYDDNSRDTNYGLANIDTWIGSTKWDVISFNFGIWDMGKVHPLYPNQGHNGPVAVPLAQYESNLDAIITKLKLTNAKLVWQTITIIPEGEPNRYAGDEDPYNAVAVRVMKKHGIPVNDLHTLTKAFPAELFREPHDVHYNDAGYKKIAESVAASIKKQL